MENLIWIVLVALFCLLIVFLPNVVLNAITNIFSMEKFGIRKIKRYRTTTDSFGNFMIFILLLFCIFYFLIPGYKIIYSVFYWFAFLCCIAQANRVTKKKEKRIVLFCVSLLGCIGYISAMGFVNQHMADVGIQLWLMDHADGKVFALFYFLTNRSWFYLLFQGILFIWPVFCMWSQFKYMRLENSIKAYHIVTYVFKTLLVCSFILGLGYYGFEFLDMVYQVEALSEI